MSMCLVNVLKVVQIIGESAIVEGDRKVIVGNLKQVKIGDYLEVYGPVALQIYSRDEAMEIEDSRKIL